ncbi:hypothetical protein A3J13_00755 [Candidatus Daviesbacteria bacterium RIFCSPLOWO2_02_FULL_36_8]|uniref:Uncharacterized protein n=1 Tax=Candidatus Daviesbacteria bacterium RIFCSPLOWO2_02_FULL_36_8 TaxID=1797793 RepID=A0A1F5MGR5_9BACT|nr:MAG: hypothetical protein A3J13_00755 [Candidatus Daviesbacteria bacterium RIFCSPLOWO2_02_FULL_36_8]
MGRKIIPLVIIIVLLILGAWYLFFRPSSNLASSTSQSLSTFQTQKKAQPSETLIDYEDPSGFSFSYPDNLSISKADLDDNTYADLELSSKDVSGSLSLKITDSKFKTLDEWVKLNREASKEEPREVKLGTLKAIQITTADRIMLGSLDQGIFFSIEMPKIEEGFWNEVYNKLTSNFSFVSPSTASSQGTSSDDVSFEGEEVVQ